MWTLARRWAFAAVPLVAVVELGLHVSQVNGVTSDADWAQAKQEVQKRVKPDDLVAFAPRWVDPIGREKFGPQIATLEREAYPDVTRFPRALEVSIRGEHVPDLAGWKTVETTRAGAITITTLQNPSPVVLKDDLLRHAGKPDMHVYLAETSGARDCPFIHSSPRSGGLGFGPAIPGDRYQCQGNALVGLTVLPDLNYLPRRCFYAPPQGAGSVLLVKFDAIHFGRGLHGHHGLYVEAERDKKGAPVTLLFRSGQRPIGSVVHRDGDGWKGFELDTSDLDGQTAELEAEISSPSGDRRMYCFEADTR